MDTNLEQQERGEYGPSFGLIPVEHIPLVWIRVLRIMLDQGKEWLETVSELEILAQLSSGVYELWIAGDQGEIDGYVIGAWEVHARKTRYHVIAIAGEHFDKYFPSQLEKIEHYASLRGASEVVMEGRKGWKRLLEKQGYHEKTVRMVKPVTVLWRN